jgi:glutamate-1-semialdehyde 2,1-aminomutase
MAMTHERPTTGAGSAGQASQELYERARRATPGGVHTSIRNVEPALTFARAQGSHIWDSDGRDYIDYHAAFGPFILGHAFPAVTEAVRATLDQADLFGVGTTELEVRLAEKIVAHVPCAEQVLLCVTGSEATYHALRLARAVTGRQKLIKFQGCYHGWHDYVTRNMLSAPERIGTRDPGSAGMLDAAIDATLVCTFNDLDSVERTVRDNAEQIAAIIVEPIPHNIGCVLPAPGFLEGLRALATREGIVLVFDEVITGFRHGLGGYQAVSGVTPDLATFGKAMANGFPIAALAGRREMMERFNTRPGGDVLFAGTYNGHALSTAAALATIEILEREPVYEHTFRLGDRLRAGLGEITARLGVTATVAGFGSVFVTYFMDPPVANYTDLMRNDVELFVAYRRELIARGVYCLPLNLKRNHVSYSHSDADVDRTLEAAEEALRALLKGEARA